jgi:hypothetical protein
MQQASHLEDLRRQQEILREGQLRDAEEVRTLLRNKQEAQAKLEDEVNLERDIKQELYREVGRRDEVVRELKVLEAEESEIVKRYDEIKETLSRSPQRVKYIRGY